MGTLGYMAAPTIVLPFISTVDHDAVRPKVYNGTKPMVWIHGANATRVEAVLDNNGIFSSI